MTKKYDREDYLALARGNPSLKDLIEKYPEEWQEAGDELAAVFSGGAPSGLQEYMAAARAHDERIVKSGINPGELSVSFPRILKARMAALALHRRYLYSRSGRTGRIRLNLWNGTILQKLFFAGSGFEQKPASLFWYELIRPLITQKRIFMPLVNKKGIYCFYSRALIQSLAALIGPVACLEIGAGNGALARFLSDAGVAIRATDDFSWSRYIEYPPFVEKLKAEAALRKYEPATVICAWPPPRNNFEKKIFAARSVRRYIVIGSRFGFVSGDQDAYAEQTVFEREDCRKLARLLLPRDPANAVFIFNRKSP